MDYGRLSGVLIDRSGTATTSSAKVADANSSRRYLIFQNIDSSITMYVNFASAATAGSGSLKVIAGATLVLDSCVSTDQVNVIAASGTPAYTCKEF